MEMLHIADQTYLLRRKQSDSLIFLHEWFHLPDAQVVFVEIPLPLLVSLLFRGLLFWFHFVHFGKLFECFGVCVIQGLTQI